MTYINADIEQAIDNKQSITLTRDKLVFNIKPSDIECYGNINFTEDSDDMKVLSRMNWLSKKVISGKVIPANYDYENNCTYSDLNVPRWSETFNPAKVVQYIHGIMGKPERVIIFKSKYRV